MHGTRGAGLTLHLSDLDGLAPEVLLAVGSPLVHVFRHRGRRRDRVDGSVLAEQVSDIRRCLVTITGDEFLFFSHKCLDSFSMFYIYFKTESN